MKKLTLRDLKFFLLGIVFVIGVANDWEAHKAAFTEGIEAAKADKPYSYNEEE
ncbi:hypothetical protein [uncultured Pontibacter sp.]|uniref:hypothetical protein n=1 Tax=uncultured Pontibacter sp. TaxID=453356 RepID=UPI00262762FE|nr:hypothetical protein [uncultured Pontibacter sp.]